MKKILVIGSGGAGKSTFSRRLGKIKNIEVIHLDKVYWQPNWIEPSKGAWQQTIKGILEKNAWILDGNFGGMVDLRLEVCDTVILLDLPRFVCLYRVLKRRLKYRGTNRPDMSEGCSEKINLEFLRWIWNYPRIKKPAVEAKLNRFEGEKTIIRLKSKREVENFLLKFGTMK